MSDEITITLPVSGKEVVIRNYTTKADEVAAHDTMYKDAYFADNDGGKIPMGNAIKVKELYVKRLVRSIDGEIHGIENKLLELRSTDYRAIDEAVEKIVGEFDPKDQEAAKTSAS